MPPTPDKARPHHTWHESFRAFHLSSTEKYCLGRAISARVTQSIPAKEEFLWIDIGCGDCSQILEASAEFRLLESVYLFDPNWSQNFAVAADGLYEFVQRGIAITIYPSEFSHGSRHNTDLPFVLTAVHSLFDEDVPSAVSEIKAEFQLYSPSSIGIVVAENDMSFIAHCRARLRSKGIVVPKALSDDDLSPLMSAGLEVSKSTVEGQTLSCGDPGEGNRADWLAPFICGETRTQFEERGVVETRVVRSTLSQVWREFGGDPVPIPDNLWAIRRPRPGE